MTRPELEAARLKGIALIVLATGVSAALVVSCVALLYDGKRSVGLSANASQVLTTAIAGIVAILGAYIGFRAGVGERESPGPWPGESEAETREFKR